MRWMVWTAMLLSAGCAALAEDRPVQVTGVARGSDPALIEAFFGPDGLRALSPTIRCGVRCGVVR